MKVKTALVTVLAAMLAVMNAIADDQADHIKFCRENPTEDLARLYTEDGIKSFANADAIAYFQDHSDIEKHLKDDASFGFKIGTAHAFAHHLLGDKATLYAYNFEVGLQALMAAKG